MAVQFEHRALVILGTLTLTALAAWACVAPHTTTPGERLVPDEGARAGAPHARDNQDEEGSSLTWLTPPRAPTRGRPLPQAGTPRTAKYPLLGRAMIRDVPIVRSTERGSLRPIGAVRLGSLVRVAPVSPANSGAPCASGWLSVAPRGYVCPGRKLAVGRKPPKLGQVLPPPDPTRVVPYRYVKVKDRDAYRYRSVPTPRQRAAVRAGKRGAAQELRARRLAGTYFLAVEETVQKHGERWWRTLEGNYVRAGAVDAVKPPTLVGERLKAPKRLPMAFVVADQAEVRSTDGKLVGHAKRYARVSLARGGKPTPRGYLQTRDGHLLPRDQVRIARRVPRPSAVAEGSRWLQIDVNEQTLVAYEGDHPVYATLVSTGKAGRRTPKGTYRVERKLLSSTMRGKDPDGPYEVQQVPWVLFYDGPYAVHGAYWHDDFGTPRSHGCTNLAPADARFLFRFTDPEVPAGWHTSYEPGSHVHIVGT